MSPRPAPAPAPTAPPTTAPGGPATAAPTAAPATAPAPPPAAEPAFGRFPGDGATGRAKQAANDGTWRATDGHADRRAPECAGTGARRFGADLGLVLDLVVEVAIEVRVGARAIDPLVVVHVFAS